MRRAWAFVVASGLGWGCAPSETCPRDRILDAGCPAPSAACVDAGEERPCDTLLTKCLLCVPSNHAYILECERRPDAGLRWGLNIGIPPPGCFAE